MPTYEFVEELADGTLGTERMERVMVASLRPAMGETIEVDGKKWRRVPSYPMRAMPQRDVCFASRSAFNRWTAHKGKFDSHGRPVFTSYAQIREAEARSLDEGGRPMLYDSPWTKGGQ